MTFAAPEGCTYKIPTKTIDELLFTNNQLEFTSNFKEKASKQAVYKIKVEQRVIDYNKEPDPCNPDSIYAKDDKGNFKWETAIGYRGKFKIKMKSIVPNYDFTVYNMKSEPIVSTVENYYGGEKSCYYSCATYEVEYDANNEMKVDADGYPVFKTTVD